VTSRTRRDEWEDYVESLAAPVKPEAPFDGPHGHARRLLAFCIGFARTGNAAGDGCWIPPSLERRYTRRTVERYLAVLVDHGLVKRTTAPSRGQLGKPGRKARYALLVPQNLRRDSDGTWRTIAVQGLADVVRGPWSDAGPSDGGRLSTTSATVTHGRAHGTYSRSIERCVA
jgi:hypothetical protein